MPAAIDFPKNPAFAGLRDHFAKLDDAAARQQAAVQLSALKRQWLIVSGKRPSGGDARREYDRLIGRMTETRVDAPDLLALIRWLEETASPQAAAAALDASLARIAASDDITRYSIAAE
jgi:hypothetical protein